MRAVNAAFNDGAKLVTRIRDDRLETERALPEEPTRDLLDSLQLGPVLVKGQYDRDLRRFGEPFACGDGTAREQMKDVLINLQMALIISLRGISMDDGDVDFESLQQTSDDCRTNAGVCLGQLSQRLSDTAKAQALIPEAEMLSLPPPKHSSLAYSSSRSTRSTRSSGRDPRTPPDSIHENFASMSVSSNSTTIRPHTQERKRSNSSASKRSYQPRRPTTPQSQIGSRAMPTIAIPQNNYQDSRGGRLRHAPSREVLTPPDEDTLNAYHHGYLRHQPSHEEIAVARGSGSNLSESAYHANSYAGRHRAPSVNSARSQSSRSRQVQASSHLAASQAPPERSASRAKFGGIPSDPVSISQGSLNNRQFDMSALDDPTTSEEEDIISMRRPSSHALGVDEHALMSPQRPESPAQSFVVSLPEVDHHEAPISPISPISERHDSDHDSIPDSPEVLSSRRYHGRNREEHLEEDAEDHQQMEVNDTTPTLGPGEFGYATVYETSRIKPAESMPRYDPPPRVRQPRNDSLSRLRESRQYGANGTAAANGTNERATPVRSQDAMQATIRAAETRVRHYRNRPTPDAQQPTEPARPSRLEHVAYMQQTGRLPKQFEDLPLPPPPRDPNRPNSRSSARSHHKPQQGYKVFPTTSSVARGAPLPPPTMAPPAPPSGPRWTESLRPSTSPGPPPDLTTTISNTSFLRPTTSATTAPDDTTLSLDALPQGEPGPATTTTSTIDDTPAAISSSSSDSEPAPPPPKQPKMVRIVPLDMAMYGGLYVPPAPPKPKKPKPAAPPMPVTLPLTLPTEKHLQGFCKAGFKVFLTSQPAKAFSVSSRPSLHGGNAAAVPIWQCGKCHFQGPLKTVSVERRLGKKKELQIFDPKVRNSPVKGVDGQSGGVRYKWVFLAKCHVPLRRAVDWGEEGKRAGKGEVGGFG